MRIIIDRTSGPIGKKIVSHVFVNKIKAGVLIVITANNRQPEITSSFSHINGGVKSIGWLIEDGQSDGRCWDVVEIIPDNKTEESMLDGLPYTLFNKDQIEIVIIPWSESESLESLVDTFDK